MPDLRDRIHGMLLGLACGDAVGTTVEFRSRDTFPPLTDMVGGGPFELAPGQWTDDTSMALCLATSLTYRCGFDAVDQMNRYVNWWHHGYLSATGECFDIGGATARALQHYLHTSDPFAGSTDPATAGNGSLMRLAPVVAFFHRDRAAALAHARLSSRTTHGAPEAVDCCEVLADWLFSAMHGATHDAVLAGVGADPKEDRVRRVALGSHRGRARETIRSTGYCVDSLEAAAWCFAKTRSFEAAVLLAANLGDDADTVAAITGQIAGAHYGRAGIPAHWVSRLALRDGIERLADALTAAAPSQGREETR